RLWRQGRPLPLLTDWPRRLKTLTVQALLQQRTRRRNYAGKMHVLIFFGFLILFIGTNIVAVEHYGALVFGHHWLYKGAFYLVCKIVLDLFGLGLIVGTLMALGRRWFARPFSLGHRRQDDAFLVLLLVATVTGFLLEGAGIAADPHRAPFAAFSPIGSLFAAPLHGLRAPG